MSAKVHVVTPHRSFDVDRASALRKVATGIFEWDGRFCIRERSDTWVLPRKAGFLWSPRPSGNFIVMQARWGLTA